MTYIINKFNNTKLTVISDGSIDTTTDLTLVGKNYAGFGTIQNDNFVYLLENFANSSSPPKPLPGQIWFDTVNNKLKFYDVNNSWKSASGSDISSSLPSNLSEGDFWFDPANNQLYVYSLTGLANGPGFVLIGPNISSSTGSIELVSVQDVNSNPHDIFEATINNSSIFTISDDSAFELLSGSVNNFTNIKQGITLAGLDVISGTFSTGNTTKFWGTASSSDSLTYIPDGVTKRTVSVSYDIPSGSDKASIPVRDGVSGIIQGSIRDAVNIILSSTSYPGALTATPNTTALRDSSGNITAVNFTGLAAAATNIKRLGVDYPGDISVSTNTTALRDNNGDITATIFHGTATASRYGDLAEKYLADAYYDIGTVIMIGGDKEVTAAAHGRTVIGTISKNPGVMMNAELQGGVFIALKGRVPVKTIGKVKKGMKLTISLNNPGIATAIPDDTTSSYFAIALESSDEDTLKLIEALIL